MTFECGPEIGAGSFGKVYLAVDTQTDQLVALKIAAKCTPKAAHAVQMRTEIQCLQFLSGTPSVVKMLAHGEQSCANDMVDFHVALELADGSVHDMLRHPANVAGLRAETLVAFVLQIGSAIIGWHKKGVVHRDLKPGNILYFRTADPLRPRFKACDWGAAKFFHDECPKSIVGTPGYYSRPIAHRMSQRNGHIPRQGPPQRLAPEAYLPEQAELFAWGCTICEVTENRLPFPPKSVDSRFNYDTLLLNRPEGAIAIELDESGQPIINDADEQPIYRNQLKRLDLSDHLTTTLTGMIREAFDEPNFSRHAGLLERLKNAHKSAVQIHDLSTAGESTSYANLDTVGPPHYGWETVPRTLAESVGKQANESFLLLTSADCKRVGQNLLWEPSESSQHAALFSPVDRKLKVTEFREPRPGPKHADANWRQPIRIFARFQKLENEAHWVRGLAETLPANASTLETIATQFSTQKVDPQTGSLAIRLRSAERLSKPYGLLASQSDREQLKAQLEAVEGQRRVFFETTQKISTAAEQAAEVMKLTEEEKNELDEIIFTAKDRIAAFENRYLRPADIRLPPTWREFRGTSGFKGMQIHLDSIEKELRDDLEPRMAKLLQGWHSRLKDLPQLWARMEKLLEEEKRQMELMDAIESQMSANFDGNCTSDSQNSVRTISTRRSETIDSIRAVCHDSQLARERAKKALQKIDQNRGRIPDRDDEEFYDAPSSQH